MDGQTDDGQTTDTFIYCKLTNESKKIFKHFNENRSFLPPRQPIKFTDLDKSHMKCRGLLN